MKPLSDPLRNVPGTRRVPRISESFSAAVASSTHVLRLLVTIVRYRIQRLRLAFGALSFIVCLTTAHR